MEPLWSIRQACVEYAQAAAAGRDCWVPAGGGMETPFLWEGVRWLYCWNPATGKHGYLNMSTDTVHDDYRGTA